VSRRRRRSSSGGSFRIYPLVFNAIEHEKELYPPSDVRLLRSQQIEYNRIKEALRQHRIANRPLYATPAGALEDEDLEGQGQMALDNYPAHAVLQLQGLAEDQKVSDKLQAVPKVPVDPNLYESEGIFNDMERISGSAEANLGGTAGGKTTATESNISEGSRLSSLESNADDLDSLLTHGARRRPGAAGRAQRRKRDRDRRRRRRVAGDVPR
jgi:hypothetical protein